MVQAILAGRKTQTRRVLRVQPLDILPMNVPDEWVALVSRNPNQGMVCRCKYGKPGDQLWVRESGWERPERTPRMMREGADTWARYYFDADGHDNDADRAQFKKWGFKRRPSIFMPRWASRITLSITAVRVERVQDISEADAVAEGVTVTPSHVMNERLLSELRPDLPQIAPAQQSFCELWDDINKKRGHGWDTNPFVWVIEFGVKQPKS